MTTSMHMPFAFASITFAACSVERFSGSIDVPMVPFLCSYCTHPDIGGLERCQNQVELGTCCIQCLPYPSDIWNPSSICTVVSSSMSAFTSLWAPRNDLTICPSAPVQVSTLLWRPSFFVFPPSWKGRGPIGRQCTKQWEGV